MIPPEFLPILASAKDYADIILKKPLEEVGALLTESVGLWRLKNRVRVMEEAKKICERHKIKPEKILPSILVPLLEEAGNVDDENLSDMFATLLAAHLDPTKQDLVHPAFAKVLGQLSPFDAQLFVWLCKKYPVYIMVQKYPLSAVRSSVCDHFAVSHEKALLAIDNLVRLGLCSIKQVGTLKGVRYSDENIKSNFYFAVTSFGEQFLAVCTETIPTVKQDS